MPDIIFFFADGGRFVMQVGLVLLLGAFGLYAGHYYGFDRD